MRREIKKSSDFILSLGSPAQRRVASPCYGTAANFRRKMVISSLRPSHLSQLLRHTPAPLTLAELLLKSGKQRCVKVEPACLVLAESGEWT